MEVHLPHTAHTDPEALFQILLNLLDNALKYGQDPIRLLSREEGGAFCWRCGTKGRNFRITNASSCPATGDSREEPGRAWASTWCAGSPRAWAGGPRPEGRDRKRFQRGSSSKLRQGGNMREVLDKALNELVGKP